MNDLLPARARRPGFGVMINTFDSMGEGIVNVVAAAQEAEALGIESVWVGDHLFFHRPNLESVTTLAAMVGATTQIGLGSGVLLPALRQPMVLAKQLATLVTLSAERFMLGVGVGGEFPPEWNAVGIDPAQRGSRTDEFLEILDGAFTGEPFTYRGSHHTISIPAMLPTASTPPIWVGGRSDAALERATRCATGWLGMWSSPRRIVEVGERLEQLRTQLGRPDDVSRAMLIFVSTDVSDTRNHRVASFVEKHYRMPFEKIARWMLRGEPAEIADRLKEYVAAGVEDFILFPVTENPAGQFEFVRDIYESLQPGRLSKQSVGSSGR